MTYDPEKVVDCLALLAVANEDGALDRLLMHVVDERLAERRVRSILQNPADIDEAIQRTLLIVRRKITMFRNEGSFSAWVGRIAEREALQIKAKSHKGTRLIENIDLGRSDPSPTSKIANRQLIQWAIGQLPPNQRIVLTLRDLEGYKYEEISTKLGIPLNTVRTRLLRARRALAQIITSSDPDR